MAGASGSSGMRAGPATARALILPSLICGKRVGQIVEHHVDMATEQVGHCGRESFVGNVDEIDLAASLSISPVRCGELPVPAEAKLIRPDSLRG